MLPAVCLDQRGTVPGMNSPLPCHALRVAYPLGGRVAVLVEREVLDVYVILREIEVRLVLPALSRRRSPRVQGFIPEPDAMLGEVVGDHKLLVALDEIATQGSQLDSANVFVVFLLAVEVES